MFEEQAKTLFALYAGLPRAHGLFTIGKVDELKGKTTGRATTVMEPVTVEKWQLHLEGKQGLGIVPIMDDAHVWWGSIDIDVYPLDLAALWTKVKQYDMPVVVLRTKSGGAHVACYASEKVPAKLMRAKMMEMAVALGYPGVEIYPKQVSLASERDVGNWLNMPYFNAPETTRYAIYKEGKALTLDQFLEYAQRVRITKDALEAFRVNLAAEFDDGPPCLQVIAKQGVPAGMRNDTMFAMGVYARLKHADAWEAELDTMNQMLCSPPLGTKEMGVLIKSLGRKTYFYPCKRQPCVNFCNKELCAGREFGVGGHSEEPDILLGTLVKINHQDHPTWIIDVEGARMELETADLMQQGRFAQLCVEKINKWPKKLKDFRWQQLVQERLNSVEIIDPPSDSSQEGRFLLYLESFCTSFVQARTREEMLMGKPWQDNDGTIWFRSVDLMDYLERQHFRGMTGRQVWNVLRRSGVKHQQFDVKGRCVQAWGVKEFPKQTDEFDRPDADEEIPF